MNKVSIQVATLNCAGKVPKDHTQIIQIFQETKTQYTPDIVIVGLQEVIKSTARAMIKNFFVQNSEELTQIWIRIIVKALNTVNQFK